MLEGEEFGRLFEIFERTAFRLETLDVYDVEEERDEIARFLAGEDMGPEWDDNPWVRSMTDKGKNVSRVHVMRSPLTDYLRYELSAYPGNIKAGESIGIIDLADQESTGLVRSSLAGGLRLRRLDRPASRSRARAAALLTGRQKAPRSRAFLGCSACIRQRPEPSRLPLRPWFPPRPSPAALPVLLRSPPSG
ncbi:DUF6879 family protein [Streptomyces violaceus]|uniref:DUF6879 family protein n=1 Tax=Streptomyces violaceus TaxID=1936 RepID=UPI002E21793F|nr:DUF6879 family protein [Streptomyces violaceus]